MHMIEPLFGSVPPNWPGTSSPTFGWFQTPPPFGTRATSALPGNATSPQLTQVSHAQSFGLGMPPVPGLAIANASPNEGYAHGLPVNSLAFAGSPIMTAPALLTAVAIKRGQPSGPATDQEIEDFLYD